MQTKKNKVSLVMAFYNDEKLLKKNLPKIMEVVSTNKDIILETIVVDDGSTDDGAKYVKDNYPQIKIIKHKFNRGVAFAFNTGVRMAKGDLILMVSTDMLPDKNILSYLLPHFNDENVFAVSFHESGLGPEKATWRDGLLQFKQRKEPDEINNTFYVRKGEGIFRRRIWMELGGMDDKLFLPFYWEDLDLSYRAAKKGYKVLWEPRALVKHEHWGSIGKWPKPYVEKMEQIHMLFFIWKNIHSESMVKRHVAGVLMRLLKDPGYFIILARAFAKIGIALRARKKEKREGKVSDEAIFSRFA